MPQSLDVGDDSGMGGADRRLLQGGEAQLREAVQGLGMGLGGMAVEVEASLLEVEHEDGQGALGGDVGVELAQRACGGVAGIGQKGGTISLSLGVEPLKDGAGHIDLAPHHQIQGLGEGEGDIEDGLDVARHVLPRDAVAAGGALGQNTAHVAEGDRQAVDLGLHREGRVGEDLMDAMDKIPQLVVGEHVGEGVHAGGVGDLIELIQGLTAHAVGGGSGIVQLGVVLLQMHQLIVELVVLIVGDDGGIVDVVKLCVVFQLLAKLGGAGAESGHVGGGGHIWASFSGDFTRLYYRLFLEESQGDFGWGKRISNWGYRSAIPPI